MSNFDDPEFCVRLTSAGRDAVSSRKYGKYNDMTDHSIGMTRIYVNQGHVHATIPWGIDGLDVPVSPDVEGYVDQFEIEHSIPVNPSRAQGIYVLRKKRGNKEVLARGRVGEVKYSDRKLCIHVIGADRKHVVRLFELIRDGKIRPDVEYTELEQIEGHLNELRRLRRFAERASQTIDKQRTEINQLGEQLGEKIRQVANLLRTKELLTTQLEDTQRELTAAQKTASAA